MKQARINMVSKINTILYYGGDTTTAVEYEYREALRRYYGNDIYYKRMELLHDIVSNFAESIKRKF